jgi:hypothetical protein
MSLHAGTVSIQNGTATFSQATDPIWGMHSPDFVYDNLFDYPNGWAIARFCPPDGTDSTNNETAVWETTADVNSDSIAFKMYFTYIGGQCLLGRFRFSVTSDDRSLFADGLDNGGDVTANWTVLSNASVQGPDGMIFTNLPDGSVLASGTIPLDGIYTVIYQNSTSNVTGFRLEAIEDPSLPDEGPGTSQANGNFVLSELTVNTVAPITIDIKPGSSPNTINLGSSGTVTVAILSTATFSAATVDPLTISLAGARVRLKGKGTPVVSLNDVNHDGRADLVAQVNTEAFQLSEVDTSALLTAWTYGGEAVQGSDLIRVVP